MARECKNCLLSEFNEKRSEYHCLHPKVNRTRPAFLAGKGAVFAKRCYDERCNVVGFCGTQGRLYVPRDGIPVVTYEDD